MRLKPEWDIPGDQCSKNSGDERQKGIASLPMLDLMANYQCAQRRICLDHPFRYHDSHLAKTDNRGAGFSRHVNASPIEVNQPPGRSVSVHVREGQPKPSDQNGAA
jgi:hypothetical protein